MITLPKLRSCALTPVLTVAVAVFALACSGPDGVDSPAGKAGDGGVASSAEAQSLSAAVISTLDSVVYWETSITTGADGLGLISYYYDDGRGGALKVAHCENAPCTSATISTLDTWEGDRPNSSYSNDGVGRHSSITTGTDGLGLISYYDSEDRVLKVAHCDNAACTSATTSQVSNQPGWHGRATSIAIGADGLGLISFLDFSFLDAVHCADIMCTRNSHWLKNVYITETTVDSEVLTERSSVTIGGDGLGLIAYLATDDGGLKVAHCYDVNCENAFASTVDSSGAYLSAATGVDGLGLFSYQGDGLKVAHCDNAGCTSATTSTVDPTINVGQYTSITIGKDGLGLISYYDRDNEALKVAHCDDPACTSATVSTVDSGGVGLFSSITIGSDGLGLISYIDATNRALKVAHCENILCSP